MANTNTIDNGKIFVAMFPKSNLSIKKAWAVTSTLSGLSGTRRKPIFYPTPEGVILKLMDGA